MATDYVRRLARIIGDGNDDGARVEGARLLRLIQEEVRDLNDQAETMRRLLVRYGQQRAENGVGSDDGTGLSERERNIVNALIHAQLSQGNDVTADELVALLAEKGVHLPVKQPASVVGTMIYFAKKRMGVKPQFQEFLEATRDDREDAMK